VQRVPKIVRLALKDNYRETLQAAGFVGREAELNRLTSVLGERQSATVLVSGHRGVGKTSLVEQALKLAVGESKKKSSRLVVRLTLPHVRPADEAAEDKVRAQVLTSLARGLYFEIDKVKVSDTLRDKAKALYDKTYLAAGTAERVVERLSQEAAGTVQRSSQRTRIELDSRLARLALQAIFGALGIAGVAVFAWVAARLPWYYQLLCAVAVVAVLVIAFVKGVGLEWEKGCEASLTETLTASDKATETGILDFSPETLEFKLRELLEDLAKAGKSCVFVIDELDKLELAEGAGETAIERDFIFTIISSLKNFFTLGHAVYVFIAGEDFFRRFRASLDSGTYSPAHTLFTDVMFIHILGWRDMELLIDGLVKSGQDESGEYHKFRNYLCWVARNHVFDMLTLLSDLCTYDGGHPILEARTPGPEAGHWDTGNMPENWELLAGAQKIVGAAYEESQRPLQRQERYNQALWLSLGEAMARLVQAYPDDMPLIQGYALPGEWPWLAGLSGSDITDLSGAIEGMLAKAERFGFAIQRPAELTDAEGSSPGPLVYGIAENPEYPPPEVSDQRQLTNFESTFVAWSDKLTRIAGALRDAGVGVDEEYAAVIGRIDSVAKKVGSTAPRRTVPKSDVSRALAEADSLAAELLQWGTHEAILQWVVGNGFSSSDDFAAPDPRTGESWDAGLSMEFEGFVDAVKVSGIPYTVIGGPHTENGVLVLNNVGNADLAPLEKAYGACLAGEKGRERRKQRLPVVALHVVAKGVKIEVPTEVVEVMKAQEGRSFLQLLNLAPAFRRVERVEKLLGWHQLALTELLEGLDRLPKLLGQVSFISTPEEGGAPAQPEDGSV
jgi:Cdc6-like AAA superfamily ATPase